MMELEPSVLMPPVHLSTVPVVVFSIEQNRHPDVEAEIDYFFGQTAPSEETSYRECFVPTEGHFRLLIERILREFPPQESEQDTLVAALNDELARLRKDGILGDVVILHESLYALIKRKLASGEFVDPMELVFAFPHPAQPSTKAPLE